MFNVGDRVRFREGCGYYSHGSSINPDLLDGTVVGLSHFLGSGYWVEWDNGNSFWYREGELELAEKVLFEI